MGMAMPRWILGPMPLVPSETCMDQAVLERPVLKVVMQRPTLHLTLRSAQRLKRSYAIGSDNALLQRPGLTHATLRSVQRMTRWSATDGGNASLVLSGLKAVKCLMPTRNAMLMSTQRVTMSSAICARHAVLERPARTAPKRGHAVLERPARTASKRAVPTQNVMW